MQVIILAAGQSSRFYPFNQNIHKSENILYGKPIIEWTVESLAQTNIEEVIIIKSKNTISIPQIFQGKKYPFKLTFVDQEEPLGMADAILGTKNLIKDEFVVIGPEHIYADKIIAQLDTFNFPGVILTANQTVNQKLYGIVQVDKQNNATALVEKPLQDIQNGYRVAAIYKLTKNFISFLDQLSSEHYLLETALNNYIKTNTVKVNIFEQASSTLKYAWHLFNIQAELYEYANKYYFKKDSLISPKAYIAPNAIVEDSVIVEEGAKIYEGACIKGKTYIGKNVMVGNNAVIRDSILEENVQVGVNSEITRSIIFKGVHSHGGGFIGDSIIGEKTHLAAGFISANLRLDKKNIYAYVKNQKVDTKKRKLGAIIGSNVEIGIRVCTMPNVIISNNKIISPGEIVSRNV